MRNIYQLFVRIVEGWFRKKTRILQNAIRKWDKKTNKGKQHQMTYSITNVRIYIEFFL